MDISRLFKKNKWSTNRETYSTNINTRSFHLNLGIMMQTSEKDPIFIKEPEDVIAYIKKMNIGPFFISDPDLDVFFPCLLHVGNIAWISKGEDEHQRYFSKNKTDGSTVSYDLLDLTMAKYQCSYGKAFELLIKKIPFVFSTLTWFQREKEVWERNEQWLNGGWEETEEGMRVFLFLKKGMDVLRFFNDYAKENVIGNHSLYKDKPCLYVSNQYACEHINGFSMASINHHINMLCLLGFLEKSPFSYQEGIKKQGQKNKKSGNVTQEYIVHDFAEVYPKALEKIQRLNKHGIYYQTLTKKVVEQIFGEKTAFRVYPQPVFCERKKNESINHVLEKLIEKTKELLLEMKEDVTKEDVLKAKFSILKNKEKRKKRYLQKWWKHIKSCAKTWLEEEKSTLQATFFNLSMET